jgi:bacillithiol biosynthesis deacetylase BshB1
MKLDILVFAAHPDDAELSSGGTIIKHVQMGYKVGVVNLTRGELGTRGTPELRDAEAAKAAQIMGLSTLDNLEFRDGYFVNDEEHRLRIIEKLRKYQPNVVLCNALHDRHPDHGRGSNVVSESCFYSGLRQIKSFENGVPQNAFRPQAVYHYIQFHSLKPDFVVDISDVIDQKMEAIKCYNSQFFDPNSNEPETVIASKEYLNAVKARDMDNGRLIGKLYAEGYNKERELGVNDITQLI